MWDDYAVPGGTYRENMLRTPGQSATTAGHRSREFTYESLKKEHVDEKGDITIDRRDPVVEPDLKKVADEATLTTAVNGLKITEPAEAAKVSA
jgi:hypothetical protein